MSKLTPYARNSKLHSDAQVAQLAASIKEWGFTIPVLIEPDGGIIAGHGRVLAAQRLGLEVVPCVVAKGWTAAQKRAYVIADNRLAESQWDKELLHSELADLKLAGFDIELAGFDDMQLAELEVSLAGLDGGGDTYDSEPILPKEKTCPECGHKFT